MRAVAIVMLVGACGSQKPIDTPAESPKGTLYAMFHAIDDGDERALWANISEKSFEEGALGIAMDEMKTMPDKAAEAAGALGVSVEEFQRAKPIELVRKVWIPKFMAMKGRISNDDIARLVVVPIDANHAKIRNGLERTMRFVREDGVWKWDISELPAVSTAERRRSTMVQ
jgi:hypothetical protein